MTAPVPRGSVAVMARRAEPHTSLDDFPTPPWATRALVERVLVGGGWSRGDLAGMTCWEPACGRGHMSRPLAETFRRVFATDVHDYGLDQHAVVDFTLSWSWPARAIRRPHDWVITNPPFVLAETFLDRALDHARAGVAVFVRLAWLEGQERYERVFRRCPPAIVAPFAERVPIHRGRLVADGSSATAYAWLVWDTRNRARETVVRWIAPCRHALERPGDYPAVAEPDADFGALLQPLLLGATAL